jgi:hypothetical protein
VLSQQASLHKTILNSLPHQDLLDINFMSLGTGFPAVAASVQDHPGTLAPSLKQQGAQVNISPRTGIGIQERGGLVARMQRLQELQKRQQDRLESLASSSGGLKQLVSFGSSSHRGMTVNQGGHGQARDGDAQKGGCEASTTVGGGEAAESAAASELSFLEMRVCGPCASEGHITKCLVSYRRLQGRSRKSAGAAKTLPPETVADVLGECKESTPQITDFLQEAGKEDLACTMLQSKGLAYSLNLDEGSTFTVHQPWHEMYMEGSSMLIVLVYCATKGLLSTA